MSGVNLPPTIAGTTQQRLNGSALVFGSTRIYGPRRRTAMLLGDSNSFAYNFREAFWRRARAWGGPIKLIGNLGVLGSVTGGSIGRRFLGDWKAEAFSGRRSTRSFTVTVAAGTGVFTLPAGHDAFSLVPVVFQTTGLMPSGLVAGRVYWVQAAQTGNVLRVAATQGGAVITSYGDAGTGTLTMGTGLIELWPGLVQNHDEAVDVAYIKICTNDILAGATAEECLTRVSTLHDLVRASYNAEIILCPIAPIVPGTSSGGSWATYAAVRDAYVAGLPALAASKGSKTGYFDTAVGLHVGNMQQDGIHPTFSGYWTEADNYFRAWQLLHSEPYGRPAPRTITTRAATASLVLSANADNGSIPYDHALSPGRDAAGNQLDQSFAVGFWFRPTALPTDGAFRPIVKYDTAHPAGYAIGHFASSGNGGGISVYVGTAGPPVISGTTTAAYSGEALKLNTWSQVFVVFDRAKMLCGLFIDGRLVQWAPIPSGWTITAQAATRIGAAASFNAALGQVDTFFLAKGAHLNLDNALEYAEALYYDFQMPPGVTARYNLADGSGTTLAPVPYALPNGTLTGGGWSAAGAIPKTGIDETLP